VARLRAAPTINAEVVRERSRQDHAALSAPDTVSQLSSRRARRIVEAWQEAASVNLALSTRLELMGAAELLQAGAGGHALVGGSRRPQQKRRP
jgi:hypothetical protein